MIDFDLKTKYKIEFTNNFNRQFKKIVKQNKDISKFLKIVERLANNDVLELKNVILNLIGYLFIKYKMIN